MKESPQDKSLHARLEASKFSAEGFLGEDTRTVDQIIVDDERTLESLGISRDQIADTLQGAFEKARSVFGGEIEIRPGVKATFYESMGRIPSPFTGEGVFEKGEVTLTDSSSRILHASPLSIHLIRRHGFFQGKGAIYRTDPAIVVDMLLK